MVSSLHAVGLGREPGTTVSGLVTIRGQRGNLTVAEEAAIGEAEGIEALDYVFFRRFADGRSSQVAAYVIDNGDEEHSEADLAKIHKEVWLNGGAPLLYVGWPTRIDVLSCARGPDFWRNDLCQYRPADNIPVEQDELKGIALTSAAVSEALEKQQRFSFLKLSDGTFWDDPRNAQLARSEKAAHRLLIDAVVEADQDVGGQKHPVLRRLLLLTVLVKYLEDREVFPKGWFGQFHSGASKFFEVLQKGTPEGVRGMLGRLERKFNGDVFCLPESQARTLTRQDLRRFAELVEARTLGEQRYLWDQYSFKHLPVEVLSHLYQRFAQRGKGAIYTPPFVASLLLDYALPYDTISGEERILDPTCGSGVFLVGAFRRLVNHWRSSHGWKRPDVPTLKAILKRSIHGVELQGEALHLAAFSLALALCDSLKPNVIWNELRFDRLHETNLCESDFFEFVEKGQSEPFDVVIGNPPFMSQLTEAGARVNKRAAVVRGNLPDKQMGYLVAEQAMNLLRNGGRLCLIQHYGLLYNEKPRPLQKWFLSTYRTDYLLDFTSVRGLFDKADTKIAALVAQKSAPKADHRIIHLTFRRTFSVDEQLGFELDHYDRHVVSQHQAVAAPFTWKVNLLGGGRLHDLTARLKGMGTLEEFIAKKRWEYGEGFIAAKGGRREKASWLKGKRLLPSTALTEGGIIKERITEVKTEFFRSAYGPDRYTPPLVLVRENEKLPCALWDEGFLAYKAKVVGVHAPRKQRAALVRFFKQFQEARPALRAFCLLESTQLLVGRATAPLKRDIDNLPWPKPAESWDLSPWEKIVCEDLVDYMAEYVRLGQDSKLLKQPTSDIDLQLYSRCFCQMLGSVYRNLRPGRSFRLSGLVCKAFHFGDRAELDWPDDWTESLQTLVYVRHGDVLRTVRVVRFYEGNVVLIIKPNRLRYWIRSAAIRDADETLFDLRKQGY